MADAGRVAQTHVIWPCATVGNSVVSPRIVRTNMETTATAVTATAAELANGA